MRRVLFKSNPQRRKRLGGTLLRGQHGATASARMPADSAASHTTGTARSAIATGRTPSESPVATMSESTP